MLALLFNWTSINRHLFAIPMGAWGGWPLAEKYGRYL